MLKTSAKSLVKTFLPGTLVYGAWNAFSYSRAIRAKRAFERAASSPCYLGWNELEMLQKQFLASASGVADSYKYDPQSLCRRGRERASQLAQRLGANAARIRNALELGCSDGLVSRFIQETGKRTIAVDIDPSDFDPAAITAGVQFCQMDAQELAAQDNSIDLVFSFNAFEHFPNAAKCLAEMIRVAKPGGYIFLFFNPLYMAPAGLHAYRQIAVPYCQHLFPCGLLEDFIQKNNLDPSRLPWVNKNRLGDYRRLWAENSHLLDTITYYEILDASAVRLIERFPSCFKSKSDDFSEFIVTGIEALFQKVRQCH